MHEIQVTRLLKLAKKKSVVRWTDHPQKTIAVDWGDNNQTNKTNHAGAKYKKYCGWKMRYTILQPGECVLIQYVGLQWRQKLAYKWQKQLFIVTSQSIPDIPVYEVQWKNGHTKPKLLHWNMLLPFVGLPCPIDEEEPENLQETEGLLRKRVQINRIIKLRWLMFC